MADTLGTHNKIHFQSEIKYATNITVTPTTIALPSITLPNISGTIIYAKLKMYVRVSLGISGTFGLDGDQYIQIRKDTPGTWTNAIKLSSFLFDIDGYFYVAKGTIDVSTEVDAFNDIYELQWLNALIDTQQVTLYDIYFELDVWYTVDSGVEAKIDTIDTNVDDIETDTNELQTDWANGGRLDLILDAAESYAEAASDNTDTIIDNDYAKTGVVVTDGSNTALTFKTDLDGSTADDYWNNMQIVFLNGANRGQVRRISDYDDTTGFITVDTAFDSTPLGVIPDAFVIIARVASAGSALTPDAIATQVWSKSLPGAFTGTMAGKQLADVEDGTVTITGKLPSSAYLKGTADADGGMDTADKADVNAECDTALTDYDPPTRTEATADKAEIIAEVDANETKIDAVQGDVTTLLTETQTNIPADIATLDAKVVVIDGIVDDLFDATILIKGTVAANGSTTVFETNLPEGDDHWNDLYIVMEDGALNSKQVRRISDFVDVDGVITVSQPFEVPVGSGDAFYLTARYLDPSHDIDMKALIGTPVTDVSTDIATNLTAITSIQNNTRFTSAIPEQMQKPDAGSRGFRWTGNLYDEVGHMEDPANNEILVRVLETDGTALTTPLCKTASLALPLDDATDQVNFPTGDGWRAMERLTVGQYDLFYELLYDDDEQALTVEFGWDEGGEILKQTRSTEVSDEKGDIEDIQAKMDAVYIKTDAVTPSPTIPAQITTHDTDIKADILQHDTDIKALPTVQSTPEYLVIPSGITRINVEGGVDDIETDIPIYDTTVLGGDGDIVCVLIGSEYVTGTIDTTNSQLTTCTRGAYSTVAAAHADLVAVYEVMIHPLRLNIFDGELNMVAPDSAPTVEIVDWQDVQEIAPTAMTLISVGLYGYDYFMVAGTQPKSRTLRFSIVINAITTLRQSTLMILDKPASLNNLIDLVGGGTGEFMVNQDGYLDGSGIFQYWTDSMKGSLKDATTGSRLDDVLVTAYRVVNGRTIPAIIPPGQVVGDANGNYEMRLDAGTYVFKFYKDQYRFPTDEVTRTVTA